MKVMILCGGTGTRLQEVTEKIPKPMVEIGGRPIVWHIMKMYAQYGFDDFILLLGYKGKLIKEYFLNYQALHSDATITLGEVPSVTNHQSLHGEAGWKVTLVDTGEDTMTGGRIKRGAKYLDDSSTFALTYGDGVADINLQQALAVHRAEGRLVTVTGVNPPSRFGELVAEGNRVVRFREKPQAEQGMINGGFFFLERPFLNYLSEDESCVLERAPLERCVHEGQMTIYRHTGFWQCMDTLRDWNLLEDLWREGRAPWKVW